jgi:uncharacterized protein (TIGR03118 family)
MRVTKKRMPIFAVLWCAMVVANTANAMMMKTAMAKSHYLQTNLVSDGTIAAVTTDANLVNSWGLANLPGSPFWIGDNGTGVATLYDGAGVPQPLTPGPLIVTLPLPPGSAAAKSAPTGLVANTSTGFTVTGNSAPALFIFDTEDGTISAWNLSNSPLALATMMVNKSVSGAVYKGLAIGTNASGTFLYATNFNAGTIDVFDQAFAEATLSGTFSDSTLPAGYAPFGIANINGSLFVTYALQNSQKHDDVAGKGHGFVDIFDTNGNMIRRFASKGVLDSPWGVAQATFNFGGLSGAILIGNFGDGRINAFDPITGKSIGSIRDAKNQPIVIDDLWALSFGNGALNALPDTLYFTAGPKGETEGLFGSLTVTP